MRYSKKSYFNPLLYNNSDSEIINDQIITKGGQKVLKIDIDRLESDLDDLRRKADVMIKDLDPNSRAQYRKFVNYIRLLHDTDEYDNFFEIIRNKFKDSPTRPGTVGAYFGGCLADIKVNGYNSSCVPSVVRSIPPSKQYISEKGIKPCNQTILWGYLNKDSDILTIAPLHIQVGDDNALLFVNSPYKDKFPGLNERDKEEIKRHNIKKVKIIGYSDDGKNYRDITDDYIDLDSVKVRQTQGVKNQTVSDIQKYDNLPMILLLIIFFLVLLFVIWKLNST